MLAQELTMPLSFGIFPDPKMAAAECRCRQTAVKLAMISFVNSRTGLAWPSIQTLVDITKIRRDHIIGSIKSLVKSGWMSVQGTTKAGVKVYKITGLPLHVPGEDTTREPEMETVMGVPESGEQGVPETGTGVPETGTPRGTRNGGGAVPETGTPPEPDPVWDEMLLGIAPETGTGGVPKTGTLTKKGTKKLNIAPLSNSVDTLSLPKKNPSKPPQMAPGGACAAEAAPLTLGVMEEFCRQPNEVKRKKQTQTEAARRVIDYLNDKTGKIFRYGDANLAPIIARFNEGFTEQDCLTIVDNKVADWLYDDDRNRYLTPKTLFRKSNADGYLNESRKPKATPRPKRHDPFDPRQLQR